MPMSRKARKRGLGQRTLFDPPSILPAWGEFPPSVRAEAVRLLSKMLADYAIAQAGREEQGGLRHER
jgi:hypothetical protein